MRSQIADRRNQQTNAAKESSEVSSSEYSEDFVESTDKDSSSKNQKIQTMTKL